MLDEIIHERVKKVAKLRKEGIDPYPAHVTRSHSVAQFLEQFSTLSKSKKTATIIGRVKNMRVQGNIAFFTIQDQSGVVQVVAKKDTTHHFKIYRNVFDIGDFMWAQGSAFTTRRGEKSILARRVHIASKALRPIPTEYYGLQDTEMRLRKRYLSTILDADEHELFVKKSTFWHSMREFLDGHGFMEVDTPVFELTPGGAEAEPFMTHHNALDNDFYLRISLEISLKKMLIGGFEKIYEIGRVFRNEGIDAEHLQDYTQMEFYWAYADYKDLMKLLPAMYRYVIKKTFKTLSLPWERHTILWGKTWEKVDYLEAFKHVNKKIDPLHSTVADLRARAKKVGATLEKHMGRGRLIDSIYKKTVRPSLIQPAFLTHLPVLVSPLAKRSKDNPDLTERIQVVACGSELGNGFSELNDPQDQRARLEEQAALRKAGDKEAQRVDEDFLEAIEYGMPPSAGFGLSERLFAVLAGRPIRETIFIPPMKKEK